MRLVPILALIIVLWQLEETLCWDCECGFPSKFKTTLNFSIDEFNYKVSSTDTSNTESSRRTANERITLHVDVDNEIVIEERPDFYLIRTKYFEIQKSKTSSNKVCLPQKWKTTTWQGCGFPDPRRLKKDIRSNGFCYRFAGESTVLNPVNFPIWYGAAYEQNEISYEYRGSCSALEECLTRNSQKRLVNGKILNVFDYVKRYWFKSGTIDPPSLTNSFILELKNLCS